MRPFKERLFLGVGSMLGSPGDAHALIRTINKR